MGAIDSLSGVRLQAMPSTAPVVATPDAAAVQRFAALMQAPVPDAAALAPQSLGDRLLDGLQSGANGFHTGWAQVSEALRSGHALDAQQMLRMQLGMGLACLAIDLTSKAVSRATQSIDQVLHLP